MSKTIPSQDLRNARLRADPTCSKCGRTKTVGDFPTRGVDYWCKDCRRAYALRKYHERRDAMTAAELLAEKAKINKRQNKRRRVAILNMKPDELAEYRDRINRQNVEKRNALRDTVYLAYGGYKCACCGESERHFLSIDHINNDGASHKRDNRLRTGDQMYRWLIRKGFPTGFQILCMNCQWGKRNNKGVCPHLGKV